ncbi:MAG: YicC family protein [Methylovirgula sp.]|nr:YicC family protein [Methylovirgula sp.]
MTIASMTGFARVSGATANFRWAWEVKSVNAKGLDLRLRLPPGFDAIEAEARAALGRRLTRGTCYATLSAQREAVTPEVYLNEGLLRRLVEAISHVAHDEALRPASIDGLLGVRGVIEIRDTGDEEADLLAVQRAALEGIGEAADALAAMREQEGAALALILTQRLARLAVLRQAAEECPARKPEAIRARLAESVALLAGQSKFDETRLYQESLLLAAKADVREELDRLETHIAAASELLQKGGPIGRRLDFLAQELAREANTLCAKSNDASLTAIGLELRVEIEQFREQVQNIE